MANPTPPILPCLPMAMIFLDAVTRNPRVYQDVPLPPCVTAADPETAFSPVPKILEAIVYFLPVSKGQVYALSLEVSDRLSRIILAGNDPTHFNKEFGHTPQSLIEFIWDRLRSIATSQGPLCKQHKKDLIVSLYGRHRAKMRARFNKRNKQCEAFFDLEEVKGPGSTLSAQEQQFIKAAMDVFKYASFFFGLKDDIKPKTYTIYHSRLEGARAAYDSAKKALRNEIWIQDLESKAERRVGSSMRFDLIRYMDKILTPCAYIIRMFKAAAQPFFQAFMHHPLVIEVVPTSLGPLLSLPPPSIDDIRSFLKSCYGNDEEKVASDIISKTAIHISNNLRSLIVARPHCECALINYIHAHKELVPYPYVAVSRLCCLQCSLYAEACRKYAQKKGIDNFAKRKAEDSDKDNHLVQLFTQGCHADVISPVLLPTGDTPDLDDFVENDILDAVKGIFRVIVGQEITAERSRRLSQSTVGSTGSPTTYVYGSESESDSDADPETKWPA